MIAFIKEHRDVCGAEPICRVLQIAPSTFSAYLVVERDPEKAPDGAKRDAELKPEVRREKFNIARCTVEHLMRDIGIEGVKHDKQSNGMSNGPSEQAVSCDHAQSTLGI